MISSTVAISRESEKRIIITELNNLGVFENRHGEVLEQLSYHALVNLLAIEQAVRI